MPVPPEPTVVTERPPSRTDQGPASTDHRPSSTDHRPSLTDRLQEMPGLATLVGEAVATWQARAAAASPGAPGTDETGPAWRAFEDAFPTFYEFTNRPR